jgi:hypothetical protein
MKLTAVRGLGALSFLVEPFEDLVPLSAAVLLAGAQLSRQTQIRSTPSSTTLVRRLELTEIAPGDVKSIRRSSSRAWGQDRTLRYMDERRDA